MAKGKSSKPRGKPSGRRTAAAMPRGVRSSKKPRRPRNRGSV